VSRHAPSTARRLHKSRGGKQAVAKDAALGLPPHGRLGFYLAEGRHLSKQFPTQAVESLLGSALQTSDPLAVITEEHAQGELHLELLLHLAAPLEHLLRRRGGGGQRRRQACIGQRKVFVLDPTRPALGQARVQPTPSKARVAHTV